MYCLSNWDAEKENLGFCFVHKGTITTEHLLCGGITEAWAVLSKVWEVKQSALKDASPSL